MTNIKKIVFDRTARKKLLSGIDQTINAFLSTDMNQIKPTDSFENIGAFFTKELAKELEKECATHLFMGLTLFKELVAEGIEQVNLGQHPTDLKIGIEKGIKALIDQINRSTIPPPKIDRLLEILDIAQIPDIKNLIQKIEKKGALSSEILFEETLYTDTDLKIVRGISLPFGPMHSYFCHQPENTMKINPSVLIVNKHIFSIHELLSTLQLISSNDLLLFVQDIEKDVLSTLAMNTFYQHLNVSTIKIAEDQKYFEKIISFTNATRLREGYFLGNIPVSWIQKNKTILLKDSTDGELILLVQLKADTQESFIYKKTCLENSLLFIRAAYESNLVLGAGNCLVFASKVLDTLDLNKKEKPGVTILKKSCSAFFRKSVLNKDPYLILEKVEKNCEPYGFNPLSQKIENLENTNILEPALFVKKSLICASQKAAMVLLSQALITDEY